MSDQGWYIEVPLETDETSLADDAVNVLQGAWADWEPNDGDLEVVQIEALANIVAALARQASIGTEEIFRAFGTKLVGIPYQGGTSATTTVTFTLTDGELHTIPEATEIEIDGYAFLTVGESTNVLGVAEIPGVLVEAADVGQAANGLGATLSRVSALAFIADVTADAPTAGGTDVMTDAEYLDYLTRKLQLRADTLVTARDHETWALDWPGVGRAYAVHTDDRHVTIYIADDQGEPIDAPTKAAMLADMVNYRLVNTITTLADPTYTVVKVVYEVTAMPGYDIADLKLRIEAMLAAWLSPTGFAAPKFGDPGTGTANWLGTNIVRKNSVIDRLGDVEGVDYVVDATLSSVTVGATVTGGNLTMPGTIALPRYDVTSTGTVNGPA